MYRWFYLGAGYRRPLGVAALQTCVRNEEMTNELVRWGSGVRPTRSKIGKTPAIHVMDREADDYVRQLERDVKLSKRTDGASLGEQHGEKDRSQLRKSIP